MPIADLTPASSELLLALWADRDNWSGVPPFFGDKAERGNLTDLKRKKYVTTQAEEGIIWVFFTDKARATLGDD